MARPLAERSDLVKAVGEKKHFLPTGKIEYVLVFMPELSVRSTVVKNSKGHYNGK